MTSVTLTQFNDLSQQDKIQHINSIFEKSPWVVERALANDKQWESLTQLLQQLCSHLDAASDEDKLSLLNAHPDLVGKAALEGLVYFTHGLTKQAEWRPQVSKSRLLRVLMYCLRKRSSSSRPTMKPTRPNLASHSLSVSDWIRRKELRLPCPSGKLLSLEEVYLNFRLQNSYQEEFKTALEQVKLIAELRLRSLIVDPKL